MHTRASPQKTPRASQPPTALRRLSSRIHSMSVDTILQKHTQIHRSLIANWSESSTPLHPGSPSSTYQPWPKIGSHGEQRSRLITIRWWRSWVGPANNSAMWSWRWSRRGLGWTRERSPPLFLIAHQSVQEALRGVWRRRRKEPGEERSLWERPMIVACRCPSCDIALLQMLGHREFPVNRPYPTASMMNTEEDDHVTVLANFSLVEMGIQEFTLCVDLHRSHGFQKNKSWLIEFVTSRLN